MRQVVVQISPTTLPLSMAQSLTDVAVARAEELGIPCTITVVDGGAHVVQVTRMDGAALGSIDVSLAKARTAVYCGAATTELVSAVLPGSPLFTLATAAGLPLAFIPGAVPVKDAAGVVIGAIGAGGGSPQQDHEIAAAAAGAL
ncbi:GlcG/HbpS family heme-binding protein [Symbioplanes lichenis]|uniref:GlcG/HbpS family heme-binding protein n=1 Tax=Symbioplanes lichenis TaxID=1629072 RepID=UPI0027396969|nr:heme-binding protein [Actinoplanes lichenis]